MQHQAIPLLIAIPTARDNAADKAAEERKEEEGC
jgi:hypothetical protein